LIPTLRISLLNLETTFLFEEKGELLTRERGIISLSNLFNS
jgi:hypothetical protein